MADMVKRINKKCPEALLTGEELVAACIVSPPGQFKKSVAFGAVGGAVGAAIGLAVAGRSTSTQAATLASTFELNKQSILALSNQRWILFDQGSFSGSPKGIAGQWPKDEIIGLKVAEGKLTSHIELHFADGSVADVEAVRGSKPADFARTVTGELGPVNI